MRGKPEPRGVHLHNARLAASAYTQLALIGHAHRLQKIAVLAAQISSVNPSPIARAKLAERYGNGGDVQMGSHSA